jgi:hypothetical protein
MVHFWASQKLLEISALTQQFSIANFELAIEAILKKMNPRFSKLFFIHVAIYIY